MTSLMLEEALSAATVASRQLAVLDACLPALGQRLREVDPNLALTVARGSSDLAERGRLAPAAWADVVRLDRSLELDAVMVEGELE